MFTNQSIFGAPFKPTLGAFQPGTVLGLQQPVHQIQQQSDAKSKVKVFNFLADHGGCGAWRIIWPEMVMNLRGDLLSFSGIIMTPDEGLFAQMSSIRIQRQAAPPQLQYLKYLKKLQEKYKFRIIYEVDDLIFREDIPDYNKFKSAFTSDEIRYTAEEIMNNCDEITVTCDFMRDYYKSKLKNQNVTVIPNFVPKFWMGNFYDKDKVLKNLHDNKQRPRVLYNGSAAHFDIDNRVKQHDDFYHVNDAIIKTVKKYRWIFLGAVPQALIPLVRQGLIEFHPWANLIDYPSKIASLNVNMMVAPLANNNFNKCKSDLKYLEGACYGIPVVCQDIETYKNAPIRFNTGDEMIDQIDECLKESNYKKLSTNARRFAESRFLENEDNIAMFVEMYKYPIGSPERKHFKK